jgi:ketosteroid isomerase-like protein
MTLATETSNTPADQIRRLIMAWADAVMTKDPDRIVADYADDILLYDAIPPYKTVGKAAIRKAWADCMPHFPEAFRMELRDLAVHASGDVGVAHFLCHFKPLSGEHPCSMTWMRVTEGYLRGTGGWKVIHSHVSVPFNPCNNQAWVIADPDVVEQPDYGQSCP